MRIDELTRPERRRDYKTILHSKGWATLGSGSYADVYGKPGVDYVLKVFDANDYAYREYIDVIRQHDNPHFPRVKGKLVEINDHFAAVRLEILSPMKPTKFAMLDVSHIIQLWLHGEEKMEEFEKRAAEAMFDALPRMKEALTIIRDNLGRNFFDVHDRNLMMRGNVIVIIDPVQ